MYDIDYKNVKKGKNFYLIFLIAGIAFLIILFVIFYLQISKYNKMDSEVISTKMEITTNKDSDGNTTYSPIYYYEVDKKEYTCKSTISSSSKPSSKHTKVLYNSQNPEECMSEYEKSTSKIFAIFIILPLVFIITGAVGVTKVNKRVKEIKNLSMYGKLIKNVPYRLENTNTYVNGVPLQRPVVDYKLPSGVVIPLYGDQRNDRKQFDADGFVDLLIDESNPSIYYIDFEIKYLSDSNSENNNQNY